MITATKLSGISVSFRENGDRMLFAVGFSTSIVGLYGGAFCFGCALAEMAMTKNRKTENALLGAAVGLIAIPIGWLSYANFH